MFYIIEILIKSGSMVIRSVSEHNFFYPTLSVLLITKFINNYSTGV